MKLFKNPIGLSSEKKTNILQKLNKSIRSMTFFDKIAVTILSLFLLILVGIKVYDHYAQNTTFVPVSGGTYKELVVGEVKYVNPILAKTDSERSISRLLYSGLVALDDKLNIVPDLASEWTVSEDGLSYTFTLRDDASFQNGRKITPVDAVATYNTIKDPATKSPYFDIWKDVKVQAGDANSVVFTLPKPYGAFIYNLVGGVVGADDLGSLTSTSSINGSGPYGLDSIRNNGDGLTHISLAKNTSYFGRQPFLSTLSFDVVSSPKDMSFILGNNYDGVSGQAIPDQDDYLKLDFQTGREIMVVPNLKSIVFSTADIRTKVMNFEALTANTKINLVALDVQSQRDKIDEIKKQIEGKNIEINFEILNAIGYNSKVENRDYDLLLYGLDYGYDRDPYTFWHSSQIGKGNLAGYSDKNSDILLEDARMIQDPIARNEKYDQFFKTLSDQSFVRIFPSARFNFGIKYSVKGLDSVTGQRPEDRFNSIYNWYVKTGRVKK